MNNLLGELSVSPAYGQVSIEDPGTLDLPEWVTGQERVVANPHAIMVATRSDVEGDVIITVLEGSDVSGLGDVVFEGELSLSSPFMDVGSAVTSTVMRVRVDRQGTVGVRVFVDPLGAPSCVRVLIEP